MEDRIRNALSSLDNVTLIHTPLNTANTISSSSSSNEDKNKSTPSTSSTIIDESAKQQNEESNKVSSSSTILLSDSNILFRPWDSNDYYDRVKSFTISRWFAKPALVDPLQCARFGWINCDIDMLECTICSKRLYYSIPPSLSSSQSQKRIEEFANQVKSTGHRDTCPWRDNGSPSFYARLINVPSKTLIESYIARVNNIYNNLKRFPNIDTTFWAIAQKKETNNLLEMIIKEAVTKPTTTTTTKTGTANDIPNTKDTTLRVACIIALCGWDYYKDSDNNNSNNSGDTTTSDSIYCSYCQRVCGIWNFKDLSIDDPFKEIYPPLASSSYDNNNNNTKFKRSRTTFEYQDKIQTSMTNMIDNILSVGVGSNESGFDVNSSKGVYRGFSDVTKRTKPSELGWSWGSSFSHQSSLSLSDTIELNRQRLKPFSPINEHRWFCPWIVFSKEEIVDYHDHQQQIENTNNNKNQLQSSTSSTNSNLNESQDKLDKDGKERERDIESLKPDIENEPCGWESLLQILTKKQMTSHTDRKIQDIDVRATLKLWQ